jgi:hypothetical protein
VSRGAGCNGGCGLGKRDRLAFGGTLARDDRPKDDTLAFCGGGEPDTLAVTGEKSGSGFCPLTAAEAVASDGGLCKFCVTFV